MRNIVGWEALRLSWLKKNIKYIHANKEHEFNRYVNYDRGGHYINAKDIMTIVDTMLKLGEGCR